MKSVTIPGPFSGPSRFRRGGLPVGDTTPIVTSISPNSGNSSGGTSVTIKGSNFAPDAFGTTIVLFDGVAATSVVVVDQNTITCVTPMGADLGSIDVVVFYASGSQYGTLHQAFTYYTGVLTGITPNHGPIAGGTVVALAGYNFVNGSTILFDGVAATNVIFIDTEHFRCTTPNHATGFVDVTIQEPGGASYVTRGMFQYTLLNRGEDLRRLPAVTINLSLNNNPNTASYTIDGDAPQPQYGEKVEIHDPADGDRLLFGGTVQTITQRYEGQPDQLAWDIQAIDYTFLLKKYRPFGSYIATSATYVVKDLFTKWAPLFTTVHVQSNLAKVTLQLDGSEDLAQVLTMIATQLGGGHWRVDNNMDIHFFHIAPAVSVTPPSAMPAATAFMTVAEGALSSAGQLFPVGYYLFRHTFLYSDGSESSLQSVSNLLLCTGQKILSFTGIPLGTNPGGGVTCIGRRIYYNRFITGYPGGDPIELITGFCQINDNTTTAFTTWFGALNASVNTVAALGPIKTFPTPSVTTPDGFTLLSSPAAALLFAGSTDVGTYGLSSFVSVPGDCRLDSNLRLANNNLSPKLVAGQTVLIRFTASNGSGETPLGGVGVSAVLTAGGFPGSVMFPGIFAPALPSGASSVTGYASLDGGVTYGRIGIVAGGQLFTLNNLDLTLTPPLTNTARIIARGWVGYNGITLIDSTGPFPASGGTVAYFATTDLAILLENLATAQQTKPPIKQFNSHPAAPTTGPAATYDFVATGSVSFTGGVIAEFKVAYLYRDGSVSWVSPASNTLSKPAVVGDMVKGFNLTSIPVGPTLAGGMDVVARFVYYCIGTWQNPNLSLTTALFVGEVWPDSYNNPTWAGGSSSNSGILIVPDNTTTSVLQFALADINAVYSAAATAFGMYPGKLVGRGNYPYSSDTANALSTDPVPVWPNPDGPSLEDDDPPNDIDDNNFELLHQDTGSQSFEMNVDLSQLRNRVYVFGSSSITAQSAAIGDAQISMADIAAMSPSGGTLRYVDPTTGNSALVKYTGVGGVVGNAYITLAASLTTVVPQGTLMENFYQADSIASQKILSKIELDVNGNQTDGVHEYVVRDPTLKAAFQLYMRANAELEMFAMPIITIKYATTDPKSTPGQTVHVDLTNPPCQGDFLIQSVTIDWIAAEADLTELSPRYTVIASSSRYQLNDLLLQLLGSSSGAAPSASGLVGTATNAAGAALATALAGVSSLSSVTNVYHIGQSPDPNDLKTFNTVPLVQLAGVAGQIIIPFFVYMRYKSGPFSTTSNPSMTLRYAGVASDLTIGISILGSNNSDKVGVAFTTTGIASAQNTTLISGANLVLTGTTGVNNSGENVGSPDTLTVTVYYMKIQA